METEVQNNRITQQFGGKTVVQTTVSGGNRKEKKNIGNCLEEKQYPHLEDSTTNLEYSLQSGNQSWRK